MRVSQKYWILNGEGVHIKHRLDYQGIPFRCNVCHYTGHLWRDCSGKLSEEKSEDTMLQEDPPDYMMEVDSLGEIPIPQLNRDRTSFRDFGLSFR
jgi:hypothetical protein